MPRDFGMEPGAKIDPRLRHSLPARAINNYVRDIWPQFRSGWISEQTADDAHRALTADWITHQLEHDPTGWINLTPQQRQHWYDYTRGINNGNESDEAIERRVQVAKTRVAGNTAYALTDGGMVPPERYNAFWESKAPEPYRRVRQRIGLGQEVEGSLDGKMRPLSEREHLKLARALAALDRGEDVPAEPPPPEPAKPAPRSYARSRSEFSDFDMARYVRDRNKEEAEARKREAYDDTPGDEEADPGPQEI
jgi:hypothetical protein